MTVAMVDADALTRCGAAEGVDALATTMVAREGATGGGSTLPWWLRSDFCAADSSSRESWPLPSASSCAKAASISCRQKCLGNGASDFGGETREPAAAASRARSAERDASSMDTRVGGRRPVTRSGAYRGRREGEGGGVNLGDSRRRGEAGHCTRLGSCCRPGRAPARHSCLLVCGVASNVKGHYVPLLVGA